MEHGAHQIPTGWGSALLKETPAAGMRTWADGLAVKEGQTTWARGRIVKSVWFRRVAQIPVKKSFLQAMPQLLCKVKRGNVFILKLGFSSWVLVLKEHRPLDLGFSQYPWLKRPVAVEAGLKACFGTQFRLLLSPYPHITVSLWSIEETRVSRMFLMGIQTFSQLRNTCSEAELGFRPISDCI